MNKSAQSNVGRGPRRGGLQPACLAVRGRPVRRGVHSWICMLHRQRCCVGRSFRRTIVTFVLISHKPQMLILKLNISPKSPRIELSNDTFAERKCCEVFAYESETFHHRRPNGISHCENKEQKSPKPPILFARRGPPSNTAMPRPPHARPQTAAPTVETLSHTDAVKSPLVQWRVPNQAPKVPLPADWLPNPTTCLIPGPVQPMTLNGFRNPDPIRRFFTMHWTDARTHGPTDRSSTGKFGDYSPLRSERDAA